MKVRGIVTIMALGLSSASYAELAQVKGSDTLAEVMINAIAAANLEADVQYAGGGSGLGESAIVAKTQGIAPMSRPFSDAQLAAAGAVGVVPRAHVFALDGIGIFVNASNQVPGFTFETLKKIFKCEITDWSQVPNSGRSGAIKVYRRNDNSGTTEAFKQFLRPAGLDNFGACVVALEHTTDIGAKTSQEANAVGYSGRSAQQSGNRAAKVGKDANSPMVELNATNVRNLITNRPDVQTYPFARRLYIYESTGSHVPSANERALLDFVIDRNTMDQIIDNSDAFYTLP